MSSARTKSTFRTESSKSARSTKTTHSANNDRTRTNGNRSMTLNRGIIGFGVALFLVLAGTGNASALWSSQGTTTGTVTTGSMGISQTGFEALAVDYSSTTTSKVAPVTVTNTGTIPSTYSLLLRGPSTSSIAANTVVQTSVVTSAANCTPAVAFSGTSRWTTLPALTGTLAAGASAIYCVKTSLTAAQAASYSGQTMTATLALTSAPTTAGTVWSASAASTAIQTAKDTSAPTKPGTPTFSATGNTSTTITWAASTDDVAVTAYDLYRGGVLVQTGVTSPFTDTGLAGNTSYTYTVKGRDAAGNTSDASAAATVKTAIIDSSIWYTVKSSVTATKCVEAANGATRDGTALQMADCDLGTNQSWNFVQLSNGNYRVSAGHIPTSGWGSPWYAFGAAQLYSFDNSTYSQWTLRPVGTSGTLFQFANLYTGSCLTVSDGSMFRAPMYLSTCSTTSVAGPQVFSLGVMK